MDERYIHLRKTKNGSERIIPVNASLEQVLKEYTEHRNRMPLKGVAAPDRLLFIKSDGTGFNANAVYQHFKKLLDKCAIPHIGNHHGPRVHDLRHTSAVHALVQMLHEGMDLYTSLPILSVSLGHHSLAATEQYVRLTSAIYPELEKQGSPVNAFVYPKVYKAYDYDD
jgi:site-specific recombinase XerD